MKSTTQKLTNEEITVEADAEAQNSNAQNLTVEEIKLKVQAYDLLAEIQYKQNILAQINSRIGEIGQIKQQGANGKSVFFEVIYALLGKENISNYSLESLSDQYYRAMLANKLLNYSSEISNRLQAEKFKQLTSGEPIEARLPYGQPMTLTNYAKLAFNTNELPKDVEHTEAYFRRFQIIPFDVTIPENRRNPNLANEIIETELSGVFNWILEGLNRLLQQDKFSKCDAAQKAVETYRLESDSVAMFVSENGYETSVEDFQTLQDLYKSYKNFCLDNGFRPVHSRNLIKRLEALGFETGKKSVGKIVYLRR